MISSVQVSNLMSNQTQQFAAMQAYSAQMSAQMGGVPAPVSMAPAFTYGGNIQDPWGEQSAARFGVAGSSMSATALTLGAAGLGLAGGFNLMGRAGQYMDPFSGAMRGFGWGGRAATGITQGAGMSMGGGWTGMRAAAGMGWQQGARFVGGGLLGAGVSMVPGMALAAGAGFVANNLAAGAQEDYAVRQSLARNADFYNPAARSGRGFAIGQQNQISSAIRGMAEQDPFTDMGELTRVMDRAMRGGLMQGATTARAFTEKFKQLKDTLKETAKLLSTSMEGAMEFYDASQRMGLFSKADILKNAQNAVTMSGGGLSASGIMRAQTQGAAYARAQGYTGRQGAMLASRSIQNVRDMYQSGALSERDLFEMSGGLRGEQAYAAVGQQMQGAAYNLAQAPIGRAIYAALGQVQGGKFTGQLDTGLLKQFRAGQLSAGDIRRLVGQKLQSAGTETKMSFLNMQQDIAGSFAAGAGAEGWMGVMSMIKQMRPGTSDEAVKLLMNRMTGMGRRQIEYVMKLYERIDIINQQKMNQAADLLRKKAEQNEMAQNRTFEGLWRQITHKIASVTTAPLRRAGAALGRGFESISQRIRDWSLGRTPTARLGAEGQNMLVGLGLGEQPMVNLARSAGSDTGLALAMGGNVDLTGGFLQRMLGRSPGERLARGLGRDALQGLAAGAGESTIQLGRERAAGYDKGIPAEVSRRKTEIALNFIGEAGQGQERFLETHGLARDSIKDVLQGVSNREWLRLMKIQTSASGSAYQQRIAGLADTLRSDQTISGRKFRSDIGRLTDTLSMRMHGVTADKLDREKRLSVQRIAEQGYFTSAMKKDKDLQSLLKGAEGDSLAAMVDAGLITDAQQLGKARENAEKSIIQTLAGTSRPSQFSFAGVLGGLMGVGGAFAKVSGLAERPIHDVFADEEQRGQVMRMLQPGQVGKQAMTEVRRKYAGDPQSTMLRLVDRIANLSPEERERMQRQMQTLSRVNMAESLKVAQTRYAEAGRELLGTDRGAIAKIGGESFAEMMFGKGGVAGAVREFGEGGTGAQYTAMRQRIGEVAESMRDMSKGQITRLRRALGETGLGREVMAQGFYRSREMERKLAPLIDITDPEVMKARIKKVTGLELGKEDMDRAMSAARMGSTRELQRLIADRGTVTGKQDATNIMTKLSGGIDKMTEAAKGLTDVLLAVHGRELGLKDVKARKEKIRMQNSSRVEPAAATK